MAITFVGPLPPDPADRPLLQDESWTNSVRIQLFLNLATQLLYLTEGPTVPNFEDSDSSDDDDDYMPMPELSPPETEEQRAERMGLPLPDDGESIIADETRSTASRSRHDDLTTDSPSRSNSDSDSVDTASVSDSFDTDLYPYTSGDASSSSSSSSDDSHTPFAEGDNSWVPPCLDGTVRLVTAEAASDEQWIEHADPVRPFRLISAPFEHMYGHGSDSDSEDDA